MITGLIHKVWVCIQLRNPTSFVETTLYQFPQDRCHFDLYRGYCVHNLNEWELVGPHSTS